MGKIMLHGQKFHDYLNGLSDLEIAKAAYPNGDNILEEDFIKKAIAIYDEEYAVSAKYRGLYSKEAVKATATAHIFSKISTEAMKIAARRFIEENRPHPVSEKKCNETISGEKERDLRKIYILKCRHEHRHGGDVYASLHSSSDEALDYAEVVMKECDFKENTDQIFDYDYEEAITDVSLFEKISPVPPEPKSLYSYKMVSIEIEGTEIFIAEPGSSGCTYAGGSIDSMVRAFRTYLETQTNLEVK